MSTSLVQIRVEKMAGRRCVTVLRVGGVEFYRPAPDEAEAARVALEVQGTFETKLGVEFT